MRDAVEILRELVAIPSVSAMSNRLLIAWAGNFLRAAGWASKEFCYLDSSGVEKVNLVAVPGDECPALVEADLAFVCHTDTVPFAAEWSDATNLLERDGRLHGCGACDVKGSLAGILAAISATPRESVSRRVALVLTADEEVGCVGTTRLLNSDVFRARQVVICEPTSLHPASAGKGYGLARVMVIGKEAHSAFPQQGRSAVLAAARFINAVEQWTQVPGRKENPLFDPPVTTVNIGVVEGGSAKNIVPGRCTFLVEWRPIPDEPPPEIAEALKELAATMSGDGCEIEAEILRAEPGFENPTNAKLAKGLAGFTGNSPVGISFGSEASRFAQEAEEVVVVGPGDMRSAHSEREFVDKAELLRWVECVKQMLTTKDI